MLRIENMGWTRKMPPVSLSSSRVRGLLVATGRGEARCHETSKPRTLDGRRFRD